MATPSAYAPQTDGFYPVLQKWLGAMPSWDASELQVESILHKNKLTPYDFALLLSPNAANVLEALAKRAHKETLQHFGRARQLFAPLYLGNYCTNTCLYCGFNAGNTIKRQALAPEEIEQEAHHLAATGLRKVLALTGDAPKQTGADYLVSAIKILARHFPSVGIEVQALTRTEYAAVSQAGADSMTMFQETYDENLYATLHPAGPKRDFAFRLDAPQRGVLGGMRGITMGVLLGLQKNWQADLFLLAMHGCWLQQKYPHIELSFSLPRIRPYTDDEKKKASQSKTKKAGHPLFTPFPVHDKAYVQALVALRCFLPHAGITLSTRESAFLRNNLLPLGVTKLSAGVRTSVGGYTPPSTTGKPLASRQAPPPAEDAVQFVIDDCRSVTEMAADLERLGYQPVFADWILPKEGDLPLAEGILHTLSHTGTSEEALLHKLPPHPSAQSA